MLKAFLRLVSGLLSPKALPQLGRNDPCHCGSGRKYKRCCLNKDADRQRSERDAAATAGDSAFGGGAKSGRRGLQRANEPPKVK